MSAGALAGKRVVVTRPREQAEGLAARIRAAGGEPVLCAAIEIREVQDLGGFHAVADRLGEFDWAIFVSPIAVRRALQLLRVRRGARPWPATVRVAAIGRGSQRALQEEAISGVLTPEGRADSEALLAMPEFASPIGQRMVIFRGQGGRTLLGDTLLARGAHVEYAECYVRARPDARPGAREPGAAFDAVTATSAEVLDNLYAMLDAPGREQLRRTPLFVSHPRVAAQAEALGVSKVTISGPSDAEMMSALVAYFRSAK